jgi:hypothetical protein
MAGVKGRSGGARPGAGRPRGRKNTATLLREKIEHESREALLVAFQQLTREVREIRDQQQSERQMRRNEYECAPAILKRLTAIEKHLQMRQEHRFPRGQNRTRPMGRNAAAEALFKPLEP